MSIDRIIIFLLREILHFVLLNINLDSICKAINKKKHTKYGRTTSEHLFILNSIESVL